ncbi:MAG: hypothetical protein WC374_11685 [Phycisphaerae bacterium]
MPRSQKKFHALFFRKPRWRKYLQSSTDPKPISIVDINSYYGASIMVSRDDFEQAASAIAQLNREELASRIKHFQGRFKLDFPQEFLSSQPVDRLRHILLAAVMTKKKN